MTYIYSLLIFIPIAILAEILHWSPILIFVSSCIAIIPLAKLMGTATEELSVHFGQGLGGLMNATFGNAAELIIAIAALNAGLIDVVKASIVGSIMGNLLLVLGLSLYLGGRRHQVQTFNKTVAGVNTSMLTLSLVALCIPAAFVLTDPKAGERIQSLSLEISLIMMAIYAASIVFSLKTHRHLYVGDSPAEGEEEEEGHGWSIGKSVGLLGVATAFVALMSEFLVGSITHVTNEWGLSTVFIGVILVPIIGNAAEHLAAVTAAMKNKMDLSLAIAVGSSTQIALFVAPLLVFIGYLIGKPMDLHFGGFELIAVGATIAITNSIVQDGETNWIEGAQLLAAYAIIAMAFFVHS